MRYKDSDPKRISDFISSLNHQHGWNLVGGSRSKEFWLVSPFKHRGRFYFDATDLPNHIFFEYDDRGHYSSYARQQDELKQECLRLALKHAKVTGTLIRYDEVKDTIRTIQL